MMLCMLGTVSGQGQDFVPVSLSISSSVRGRGLPVTGSSGTPTHGAKLRE